MKRMVTLALLVAAMMSASMSASAQGRRGEFKGRKADFRKEIFLKQCHCPKSREARMMGARRAQLSMRDARFKEASFRDARFEREFQKFHGKVGKVDKVGKHHHRR